MDNALEHSSLPPTTPPPSSLPPSLRDRRDSSNGNWREEEASLRHQLRLLRAELASCQAKLGIKLNPAPFGSSSRKGSLTAEPPLPRRKSSISDLSSHHRSPPTPEPRERSGLSTSPLSAYSAGLPGPGSVALTRTLVSDEGAETLQVADDGPEPTATSSKSNGNARQYGESPFFASGASRERISKSAVSAQSGSGKVISGLQSDLLQARSALESTRGQLRLSQRAVEFLGRQNDDLKETKERLSTEIEGLNRSLARKERLQEEALGRARVAEASLAELQQTHRAVVSSHKGKMKELEEGKHKSDEARAKAEGEYGALSRGMKSMSDGWRADLTWLKSDIVKSESRFTSSSSAVTKLVNARPTLHEDVDAALAGLAAAQREFASTYADKAAAALREVEQVRAQTAQDQERASSLGAEFTRLRRMMAEHTLDVEQAGE